MTESDELDLSSIKPVSDVDASRHLSREAHTWFLERITSEPFSDLTVDEDSAASPRRGGRRVRSGRGARRRGNSRRVLLSGVLAATVVALIVLLPGLLTNEGSVTQPSPAQAQILHRITTALSRDPATLLIQRLRTQFLESQGGAAPKPTSGPVSVLTIDEASQSGSVQRSFSTNSGTRPGFEDLTAGNSLQIYDPSNNTIYETTLAGWKAAVQRKFGPQNGSTSTFYTYSSPDSTGPGQLSVFEQRLRRHLYRLGAKTTVDGRSALTLVPVRATIKIPSTGRGSAHEYLGTVYVSPTTYYPVEEVTRVPSAGSPLGTPQGTVATIVTDWSEYTVLPITKKSAALVSLTARHPHAQIVHGAEAYLRVSDQESHR